MTSGAEEMIDVAVAIGRWNSDTRKRSVETASRPARTSTQPRPISRMCERAPVASTTVSTSSEAIALRMKMSCAAGRL